MKLQIEISLDNVAFEGAEGAEELRRILNSLARGVEFIDGEALYIEDTAIFDCNGNRVGFARFVEA